MIYKIWPVIACNCKSYVQKKNPTLTQKNQLGWLLKVAVTIKAQSSKSCPIMCEQISLSVVLPDLLT